MSVERSWFLVLLFIYLDLKEISSLHIPPPSPLIANATYASPRCQAKYSCALNMQDTQECSCHPYCDLFDSCCADQRQPNWIELELPRDMYTCAAIIDVTGGAWYSIGYSFFLNLIDNCPSGFENSVMPSLCRHPLDQTTNGTLSVPVTDLSTGLVYRNIYCAFCNDKTIADIAVWNSELYCLDEIRGINDTANTSQCHLVYIPPEMSVEVPDCRANVIDSCPQDTPVEVATACSNGPVAYVYNPTWKIVYRNAYCSSCHEPKNSSLSCIIWPSETTLGPRIFTLTAVVTNPRDRCPTTLVSAMTPQEQATWRSICPSIRAASNCPKHTK